MSITVKDLERTVNSGLTTAIKKSEINFNQLFIYIDILSILSIGNLHICLSVPLGEGLDI